MNVILGIHCQHCELLYFETLEVPDKCNYGSECPRCEYDNKFKIDIEVIE